MQPWIQAIFATILISVAPVIFLPFIPLHPQQQQNRLKTLLSFAVGGLLGDVFLHLIPHSFFPHPPHAQNPPTHLSNQPLFDPSHNHEHPQLDELLNHDHSTENHDSHAEHNHHHNHDHSTVKHDTTHHNHEAEHNSEHHHSEHDHKHNHDDNVFENPHDHHQIMRVGLSILLGILVFFLVEKYLRSISSDGGHGHSHGHSHGPKDEKKRKKEKKKTEQTSPSVKVGGYLNLVADFLHNFTDGLAIATSFLTHPSVGFSTTVAVLFHELPHEMGDFAILIQSGFTRKQAIFAQLFTAVGALLGAFGGILISQTLKSASAFILAFTSGGFIYIATVGVIPVLLESTDFYQTSKEVIGMMCGTALMVVVGIYFESH